MKIRSGFVSNSSSSSFMVIGKRVSADRIDNPKVKLYAFGEYGEGTPYDRPSKEQIKWLKEHPGEGDFTLIEEILSGSEEFEISKQDLLDNLAKIALDPGKEKLFVRVFNRSYYFPESLEDFLYCIGAKE